MFALSFVECDSLDEGEEKEGVGVRGLATNTP